jgi:hypothetical protein
MTDTAEHIILTYDTIGKFIKSFPETAKLIELKE